MPHESETYEDDEAKEAKAKKKEIYMGLDGKTYLNKDSLIKANEEWADGLSQEVTKEEVFSGRKGGYLDHLKQGLSQVHNSPKIDLFRNANCKKKVEGTQYYIGPDKKQYETLEGWQKSFRGYLSSIGRMGESMSSGSIPPEIAKLLAATGGAGGHAPREDNESHYEN